MNELSAALDRLEAALATLESAVEQRLAIDVAAAGESTEEAIAEAEARAEATISALRTERDHLVAELEQVRAEAAALEQITDDVAGRLDGAIAGIKEVLEG